VEFSEELLYGDLKKGGQTGLVWDPATQKFK
jgi:hypothetical protein